MFFVEISGVQHGICAGGNTFQPLQLIEPSNE